MKKEAKSGSSSFMRRLLLLGSALTLLSCALWWSGPVHELSRRVSDTWFNLKAQPQVSPQVALVFIDDYSLQRYGRWPWSRTLLAELVQKVSAANPRVIGLDILLPEPESEPADTALTQAIGNAGNVVLVDKISGSGAGPLWVEPLPRFARAATAVGHAQALLDSDGICRRFPLAELSLEGPRLAFALEIARRADPQSARNFQLFHEAIAGEPLVQQRGAVESVTPVVAPISFRARTRGVQTSFNTVSAADVLDGRVSDLLRGRVAMIGFGSSDIHDRLVTPVSNTLPTPGVEIHAHIVDAILSHRLLAPMPIAIQLAFLTLVCFLSVGAVLRLGTWRGVLVAVALSAVSYTLGYFAFTTLGRLSNADIVMLSALLSVPVVQVEKLLTAENSVNRQLRQLRSSLERVPGSSKPVSGDVNWKLQVLEQLQSQLAAAYEFEHALLETSQDRIAVFSDSGRLLFCNTGFQQLWHSSHPELEASLAELSNWAAASGVAFDTARLPFSAECLLDGNLWNLRLTRVPTEDRAGEPIMLVMSDLQARMERDRTRTETLAFVTHELRTPLISIQGFAEMMNRFPNRIPADAPEVIFRESRRLVALINSYLDVLRLDSGARALRVKTADANTIVQHVVRVLEPLAHTNRMRLSAANNPEAPAVHCDEALITGALMNLASNAIKYGGEGAEVKISVLSIDNDIVFSVWNSGPAIPEQDIRSLFEPFFRGTADDNRKPGWGLGLAFVKRMVDQHNGSISVASTDATGTEFRIVLPGAIRPATYVCSS